ncbi:hypothetical protein AAAC51_32300 [Priestia megaterium]
MILKRVLLVLLLLSISKFSHTPHLEVTDPSSWTNPSAWDHSATLWSVLHPGSEFLQPTATALTLSSLYEKLLTFLFRHARLAFYWNLKSRAIVT